MAVELEHLGNFEQALAMFTRVKEMAVESPAFLCLVEKGIEEV